MNGISKSVTDYINTLEPIFKNPKIDKPIICSFSGGKSSALMLLILENHRIYKDVPKHYVFANTGREHPNTIDFVRRFKGLLGDNLTLIESVAHFDERKGSTHRIVDIDRLNMTGLPFKNMVEKYGLPSIAFPHCTRELKINPIRSFIRTELGYNKSECVQAIGMRADEAGRIRGYQEGFVYPLFDFAIRKQDVNSFFNRDDMTSFRLHIEEFEGNCDLCFKKSLRKRLTIIRESPELAADWSSLEGVQSYGNNKVGHLTFDRNGLTIKDLIEMSKDPQLEVAVDKQDARLMADSETPWLFEISSEINWDYETDCHCKSS